MLYAVADKKIATKTVRAIEFFAHVRYERYGRRDDDIVARRSARDGVNTTAEKTISRTLSITGRKTNSANDDRNASEASGEWTTPPE